MIETNFRQASLKAAMNAPILRHRSRAPRQEIYPNVYDSQMQAQQTSGLSYCHYYFYLWVLHPVAHLSNWFLMVPSIATKFQYVNSPFLFFLLTHYMFRGPSSSDWKHLIVYLTWGWPIGAETCSEWEGKIKRESWHIETLLRLTPS
jgi:hypothetical protein